MPARERPAARRKPVPSPQGPPSQRIVELAFPYVALALCSIAVYMAVMTLFQMSNNDIWIHLRTGEYVIKNGWVPIKDPYSFIAADHDYVAHEWLAGVLFYVVYAAGGVTGLIFFKAAILAASCALLLWTARLLRSRLSVILPAFTCLLYIASARYLERPHIFSYLMAAVYLWLFFSYREGSRNRKYLYAILAAHAVWTNLHGGYVQGLAMVATFALGEALILARARYFGIGRDRALPARDVGLLGLLVPGCVLATLVNPYGYRLLTFPFELTGLELFMRSIYEWQPPYHISYNTSTMFFFYMIQVGALCAAFFVAHRDRTRSKAGGESLGLVNFVLIAALALTFLVLAFFWFERPPTHWKPDSLAEILFFILALFSLYTLVNFRSVDFTQAGVFALFFILSLRHNRAVTDAAMGIFVVLTASASAILDRRRHSAASERSGPKRAAEESPAAERPRWRDMSRSTSIVAGSALMLAVSAHAAIFTYYFDFRGSGREKGFGIADNMPVCATDFIAKNHITGNAFVSYPFAAMLIHRMHPDVKVNMDSRNDVYGEALYLEYLDALRSPDRMRQYLNAHPIDFFLLSYGDRSPPVFDYLESTGEWFPIYYDMRAFIEVKRKPETEDLIRTETFKVIRPAVIAPTNITSTNAPQVLEESERLIRDCPTSIFGWFYKTKALFTLGRYEESLAAARRAVEMDSSSAQAYADMAAAYAALNQRDKAIEALERAVKLDPAFGPAQDELRKLRGF